jgi:hypothetical protein
VDATTNTSQHDKKGSLHHVQGGPMLLVGDSIMRGENVAPETRGVAVELLATVDLGPEIEGMEGRQLRLRMVTIEPGGVFGPVHDHERRPGTVYILQGTITDHRDGIATDYGPGVGWPRTGTPSTGSRTGGRYRRWRSQSMSSGTSSGGRCALTMS